jgi:hypothetical protein
MGQKSPDRGLGHTLRNILSPAMMIAERLSTHSDPAVQRYAKMLMDSLDRATAAIHADQESRKKG